MPERKAGLLQAHNFCFPKQADMRFEQVGRDTQFSIFTGWDKWRNHTWAAYPIIAPHHKSFTCKLCQYTMSKTWQRDTIFSAGTRKDRSEEMHMDTAEKVFGGKSYQGALKLLPLICLYGHFPINIRPCIIFRAFDSRLKLILKRTLLAELLADHGHIAYHGIK